MQLPPSSVYLSETNQLASHPSHRHSVGHSVFVVRRAVVLSAIYIATHTGVTPAAITGCRLAQQSTPRTVHRPTSAGRLSKQRNLIICLALERGLNPRPPARQSSVIPLDQQGKLTHFPGIEILHQPNSNGFLSTATNLFSVGLCCNFCPINHCGMQESPMMIDP